MAFISRIVSRSDPWYCQHEIQYTSKGPLYRFTESRSMGHPETITYYLRKDDASPNIECDGMADVHALVREWTHIAWKSREAVCGPRSEILASEPRRPGDGMSLMWTREIYGVKYSFTRVIMPDGELRWFLSKWVPSPILDPRRFPTAGKWVRVRELTLRADGSTRGQRFNN